MTHVQPSPHPDPPRPVGVHPASAVERDGHAPRLDIQALRALAVAMVVVYHFWPSLLPGGFVGVDVFFVISGFLITGALVRRPPSRWRHLAEFWARRILRLVPAVVLTLVVSLVAIAAFLPLLEWRSGGRHALASMFYLENWHLVLISTDYLAANGAEPPFQHFWSLSVEEQYYVGWPLVIGLLTLLARRAGLDLRRTLLAGVALTVVASFVYGLSISWSNPSLAYFSTPARVWELGLGGLLAVSGATVAERLGSAARRNAVALLGVAMMLASGFLLSGSSVFPGYNALLPTVGAVLFIAAADPGGRWSLRPVTHARPVQLVGDTSYAIYLWHWPLLVLVPLCLRVERTWWLALLLLPIALVLSWLSTTFVENPLRPGRDSAGLLRRAGKVWVVSSVVVVALCAAMLLRVELATGANARAVEALPTSGLEVTCLGAGALDDSLDCPAEPELVTTPEFAKTDLPSSVRVGQCLNWPPFGEVVSCSLGETEAPTARIALYGNSHAGQWQPALERIAGENQWQVDTFVVGVCQPTTENDLTPSVMPGEIDTCDRLEADVLDTIAETAYDVVVMSTMDHDTADPAVYERTLQRLADAGREVLVVRDTPAPLDPANDTPTCLAYHLDDPEACAGSPADWIRQDPLTDAAVALDDPAVTTLDLNEHVCETDTCQPVVGGVIVWADYNHLSATYVTTLAPYLEPALLDAVG